MIFKKFNFNRDLNFNFNNFKFNFNNFLNFLIRSLDNFKNSNQLTKNNDIMRNFKIINNNDFKIYIYYFNIKKNYKCVKINEIYECIY